MMLEMIYTLCFITAGDEVLMLRRKKPPNLGLWNGVGGHIESGETPFAACCREILEETGYKVALPQFAGILTWDGFETPPAGLYIFTAEVDEKKTGLDCDEGLLAWKKTSWVTSSPQVVSNIHFFLPGVLNHAPPQHYHFTYASGVVKGCTIKSLPVDYGNDWIYK